MTAKELAEILTGREYGYGMEITGIVLKKMDGQWSPPKAAIYDKTDHNPVHAMAF